MLTRKTLGLAVIVALGIGMCSKAGAFVIDLYEIGNGGSPEIAHYTTPELVGTGDIIILEFGAPDHSVAYWSDILRFGGTATQSAGAVAMSYDVWLISGAAAIAAANADPGPFPESYIYEDANGFVQYLDEVTYGAQYNVHSPEGRSVPDVGSTMALLGLAVTSLGAAKRFMRS